jgi:hypothetical protein
MREFIELMQAFCSGALTAHEFERQYLDLWGEINHPGKTRLGEREAKILDTLFYDVDAFTDDPDLLQDPVYGRFSIDVNTLREGVKNALEQLIQIEAQGNQ